MPIAKTPSPLVFAKSATNPHMQIATGKAGKFTLLYNPETKKWTVKENGKLVSGGGGVTGLANAVAIAQIVEDEFKPTRSTATAAKVTPITGRRPTPKVVTVEEEEEEEPVKPKASVRTVSSPAKSTTTKTTVAAKTPATRKPKPFPEFDAWCESNVELEELLEVPARGPKTKTLNANAAIEERNSKTLKGAKLKWGRERKAYNTANGIETETSATTPVKATPATRIKVTATASEDDEEETTATRGKRNRSFGETTHPFGDMPTDLELAVAKWQNAKGSLAYAIVFLRKHPYGLVALDTAYKAIERVYLAEEEVETVSNASGETPPKNYAAVFYGNPLDALSEEYQEFLGGYIDHYITGKGKGRMSATGRGEAREEVPYKSDTLPLSPMLIEKKVAPKKTTPVRRK